MINRTAKLFTTHPSSVGESYFEHLLFAARFSISLFAAAMAALIHAILPFTFEKNSKQNH